MGDEKKETAPTNVKTDVTSSDVKDSGARKAPPTAQEIADRKQKKSEAENEAHRALDGPPTKVRMLKDAIIDGDGTETKTGDVVEVRHQKARDMIHHQVARGLDERDTKGSKAASRDEDLGPTPPGKTLSS